MAPAIKVGQYILKRKIGEGAFAEVRHAVHETTGEEFAVKVFDRAALPRGDLERDVKREIKIMQYLRHRGIVSIHAALVTEKKMYLVMELVKGGELYDEIVSKRRVDEKTSRHYFQQLVDAMIYCHQRGVVHRDLKPENILVTADGSKLTRARCAAQPLLFRPKPARGTDEPRVPLCLLNSNQGVRLWHELDEGER
jgi:serine/threonine protein kinase